MVAELPSPEGAAPKRHSSTARTSIALSGLALLGSLLGMLSQLVLARTYGIGTEIEAFFVATSLPLLVTGVCTGLASYHLVPVLARMDGGSRMQAQYASGVLAVAAAVGCFIALLGSFIAIWGLGLYENYEALNGRGLQTIAMIGWLGVAIGIMGSSLSAYCQARGEFYRTAFLSCIPPGLVIITCLTMVAPGSTAIAVAVAVVVGQLAGFALLCVRIKVWESIPLPDFNSIKRVMLDLRRTPLILLAMLAFTSFGAIDAMLGVLISEGAVANLAFAQRMVVSLGSLAVNGIAVVMTPKFSRRLAANEESQMREDVVATMKAVILMTLIPATVLAAFVRPTISILFQGGQFETSNVDELASVLSAMLPGMVLMCICTVLFRALFAGNNSAAAACVGVIVTLTYFVVGSAMIAGNLEERRMGYAYGIAWAVGTAMCVHVLWRRRYLELLTRANLLWLLKAIALFGGLYPVTVYIGSSRGLLILAEPGLGGILVLAAAYAVGFALAAALGIALKIPEWMIAVRKILPRAGT